MKRYSRQKMLPEIGLEGQKRLLNAKVLIIGLGGLGSPAAIYLAGAGVGTIGLIDFDKVDETNLQRQILYSTCDQGLPKVQAAKKRLLELNPNVQITTYEESLSYAVAAGVISNYDLVLDGTDRFQTKYLINDLCAKLDKIWIYGSVTGFHGMFAAFEPHHGPCLRCYQATPPKNYVPNCQESGVLGPAAGVIGSLQAALAIKALLYQITPKPNLNPYYGKMFVFDMGSMNFLKVPIRQDTNCRACVIHQLDEEFQYDEFACSAKAELAAGPSDYGKYFVLDVREAGEFQEGSIPQAVNWPLSQIRVDPNEILLPTDREILVCCQSGFRSKMAIEILKQAQKRNYENLPGGIFGA